MGLSCAACEGTLLTNPFLVLVLHAQMLVLGADWRLVDVIVALGYYATCQQSRSRYSR